MNRLKFGDIELRLRYRKYLWQGLRNFKYNDIERPHDWKLNCHIMMVRISFQVVSNFDLVRARTYLVTSLYCEDSSVRID